MKKFLRVFQSNAENSESYFLNVEVIGTVSELDRMGGFVKIMFEVSTVRSSENYGFVFADDWMLFKEEFLIGVSPRLSQTDLTLESIADILAASDLGGR